MNNDLSRALIPRSRSLFIPVPDRSIEKTRTAARGTNARPSGRSVVFKVHPSSLRDASPAARGAIRRISQIRPIRVPLAPA